MIFVAIMKFWIISYTHFMVVTLYVYSCHVLSNSMVITFKKGCIKKMYTAQNVNDNDNKSVTNISKPIYLVVSKDDGCYNKRGNVSS
jgi:hypothetical protein